MVEDDAVQAIYAALRKDPTSARAIGTASDEQGRATTTLLAREQKPDLVTAVHADMAARIQRGIDNSPTAARRECCVGCAYCCYFRVETTPLEIIGIARHLEQTRQPEELAAVKARLSHYREQIAPLSREEHLVAMLPCPFLEADNKCGIYPVRPTVCRSHSSTSVKACEKVYHDPKGQHLVPVELMGRAWAWAVHSAALFATYKTGRDVQSRELNSGVLCAMETENVESRWLAGERLFDACPSGPPDEFPDSE